MAAALQPTPAPRPGGLPRTLLTQFGSLLLTVALVVAITQAVTARVSLRGLTLNVLFGNNPPYPDQRLLAMLITALGRSALLLAVALFGAVLLGVGTGIAYAVARTRLVRAIAWALGTVGIALPSFVLAMVLQLAAIALAVRAGHPVLPIDGYGLDRHLLLPVLALGARPVASIFRVTAVALQEMQPLDFIRLARAKGLTEATILWRHLLPPAAAPILGGVGLALRGALSSLVIVEYVFGWRGAGYGFIWAVATGQHQFLLALVVTFALLFALLASATSAATRFFDPRIGY